LAKQRWRVSLRRDVITKHFLWFGHVAGNAILKPHCAPLTMRSTAISIGRAHLSLVRKVYVCRR